jgi:hypothetical protein
MYFYMVATCPFIEMSACLPACLHACVQSGYHVCPCARPQLRIWACLLASGTPTPAPAPGREGDDAQAKPTVKPEAAGGIEHASEPLADLAKPEPDEAGAVPKETVCDSGEGGGKARGTKRGPEDAEMGVGPERAVRIKSEPEAERSSVC